MRDIVVPLEPTVEGTTHDHVLLGPYLLRISRASDEVQIWRAGQWLRFGLTGREVRAHEATIVLTAPALSSLLKVR